LERVLKSAKVSISVLSTVALLLATVSLASAHGLREDQPSPIARGPHVSGVVQVMAHRPGSASSSAGTPAASSSTVATDSASTGRPVNETSIATNGSLIVAGANDYNSYNGQGQDGFYWSTDGSTWKDAGPIDVFPHNSNNGAGDPGLAVDSSGVVYYSSLLFNFYRCNVGGLELMRGTPGGTWTSYQIASNSQSQFQDKPALALDEAYGHVFVSWTQFGSCSGANVTSPIKVAVLGTGASSVAPSTILNVPGSAYSQGSSIKPDGQGGFWIAWEEWSSGSSSATSSIRIAHWIGSGWEALSGSQQWLKISSPGFTDLPDPLPGFAFRDNSFPMLAMVGGQPWVTWTSADTGVGQAYVWKGSGQATVVSSSAGDQFFPAIAADGSGGAYVSYSQTNRSQGTYDQYLAHVTSSTSVGKVSEKSSNPSQDAFFSGQFIGDYNGITLVGGAAMPIWTDISHTDVNYPGWQMDSVTVAGSTTATKPDAPVLSATAGTTDVSLTWTTPNDGGSPIQGYNIYRGTSSGGESALVTNVQSNSYSDTTVTAGTTYYYEVTAVNGVGEGPASNEVSAMPTGSGATAPSEPQNVLASQAKGKGVQLSWSAPSSDGGAAITGYNIYRNDGSGYVLVAQLGNVTSYKDTHTTRGATYTYQVTAVNAANLEGPPATSNSVTAT
jgi:Fibronectin type III domain